MMIGNKDEPGPIEKIDEALVPDGPSQAGEIIVTNDKSVERALEEFVAQANAAQAEDYDGWDIAANIDRFVEQARSQPGSAEPPRPRVPLPGVTPFPEPAPPGAQAAPPSAPIAAWALPPPAATPGATPRNGSQLPFELLPSIAQGGISRNMFFAGLAVAAILSAAIAVIAVRMSASSSRAEPAASARPPPPPARPAPVPTEPLVTPVISTKAPAPASAPPAEKTAAAKTPAPPADDKAAAGPAAKPVEAEPAAPTAPPRRHHSKTHGDKAARPAKGWVDPFAQ